MDQTGFKLLQLDLEDLVLAFNWYFRGPKEKLRIVPTIDLDFEWFVSDLSRFFAAKINVFIKHNRFKSLAV